MLLWLVICSVLALVVLGGETCHKFKCHNATSALNCDSDSKEWIAYSEVCDGVRNCADGSDEAIWTCKVHPNEKSDAYFYCADGGALPAYDYCDLDLHCLDDSESYVRTCTSKYNASVSLQGNCGSGQFECLPNECIPMRAACNHSIECRNGRDESLPICYEDCTDQFQCGNGACISLGKVCDNKVDCVDGSDELTNVCAGVQFHKPPPYRYCFEPLGYSTPKFAPNTKYTIYGRKKIVWANHPVQFQCPNRFVQIGREWNVCGSNGKWLHEPLQCVLAENLIG